MPMIQIAKIQDSFLTIFLNMARIVYILAEFTVHRPYRLKFKLLNLEQKSCKFMK